MSAPFSPRSTFYIYRYACHKIRILCCMWFVLPALFYDFLSYVLFSMVFPADHSYTLAHQWGVRKNRPPLDTSVSYFCRCNDHSKIIKEVESILFSLSLILAIASKVFSLAGLTRFIILAPDPYFQKKKKILSNLLIHERQRCWK